MIDNLRTAEQPCQHLQTISNNNSIIAGKVYRFAINRKAPYFLYDNKENATINPGEPFLVIKTGCARNGFSGMVLVCNARGAVGMMGPRFDIIPYLSR